MDMDKKTGWQMIPSPTVVSYPVSYITEALGEIIIILQGKKLIEVEVWQKLMFYQEQSLPSITFSQEPILAKWMFYREQKFGKSNILSEVET